MAHLKKKKNTHTQPNCAINFLVYRNFYSNACTVHSNICSCRIITCTHSALKSNANPVNHNNTTSDSKRE